MIETAINFRAWLVVFGGFLIHLVLGTLYCWANITSAVTSYIRKYDDSVDYNDSLMVFVASIAAQGATMFLGGTLGTILGSRNCCFLGGYIIVLGTFLASLSESLGFLILTDGIMFGVGMGICYTTPISCAVRWMPEKKGLITGVIVAGFGFGAFVFGFIAINLVNPDHESVSEEYKNGKYYPKDSEVVERVPYMFAMLALSYFITITVGCLCISDPVEEEQTKRQELRTLPENVLKPFAVSSSTGVNQTVSNRYYNSYTSIENEESGIKENPLKTKKENKSDDIYNPVRTDDFDSIELPESKKEKQLVSHSNLHEIVEDVIFDNNETEKYSDTDKSEYNVNFTPWEALKKPLFWHISACLITTTVGGMFLAGTFKTYGQLSFSDEKFLSSISAIASVFNTAGRIFWGFLADRYEAINTLMVMSFIFASLIGTYSFSVYLGEAGFTLWTFGIFFFEGANFVLYIPITVQVFGRKYSASNYGLIFTSYTFIVVISLFIIAKASVSFSTATVSMGLFTFMGWINVVLLYFHMKSHNISR